MTDLKQLYRQAVTGRVAELQAALADTKAGKPGAEETLRRIAHSLRGSGATYGFPEVTDAAGAVEDAYASAIGVHTEHLLSVLDKVIEGGPKPCRVLMVDDDPEILLLLRTVLAGSGRSLFTAETATEGIQQLDGDLFTLIILDLLLPDMDGREVLRRIRAMPAYAETPVIVLSAKTTDETRRTCAELGATAFFEKPFDPEAVAAAVGAQLLRVTQADSDAKA